MGQRDTYRRRRHTPQYNFWVGKGPDTILYCIYYARVTVTENCKLEHDSGPVRYTLIPERTKGKEISNVVRTIKVLL